MEMVHRRGEVKARRAILTGGGLATAVIGLAYVMASAPGEASEDRSGGWADEPRRYPGLSAPSETIDLSFVYPGLIGKVPVKEGDVVRKGDVVIAQDDEVQRLTVEGQRIIAEDESEVQAAQKRLDLSELQLQKVRDAEAQKATRPLEVEQSVIDRALREIELRAANRRRKESAVNHQRESEVLRRMTLTSPIDGVVAQVNVQEGEAVDGLQAVMHIVSIDPLWMDVFVPVGPAQQIRVGDSAIVSWRDIEQPTPSHGRVIFISPVAQADSSERMVRLEIANPEGLPAKLHAEVEFPESEPAARSAGGTDAGLGG